MPEMSLVIRREDVVFVFVDFQEKLAAIMPRREETIKTAALMANVAEVLGIPAFVTLQYPRGLGGLVAELAEVLANVESVEKTAFDCMREPRFREHLARLGRRQVVITGMESHVCVTQTALSLLEEGYGVIVVADAVCSRSDRNYDVALDRLRAAGAIVTTAEAVIYEALGDAAAPEFGAVLKLVK